MTEEQDGKSIVGWIAKLESMSSRTRTALSAFRAIKSGVMGLMGPSAEEQDELNRRQLKEWRAEMAKAGLAPTSMELTLGNRTELRVSAEVIRHQKNREAIAGAAVEHLQAADLLQTHAPDEIDTTWIDRFWREAELVSDPDMQAFWGAVLARKAAGKARASVRLLHLLATLDGHEAQALEHLAACVVSANDGARIISGAINGFTAAGTSVGNEPMTEANLKIQAFLKPQHSDLFRAIGIFAEGGFAHTCHAPIRCGAGEFLVANKPMRLELPTGKGGSYDPEGFVSVGSGYKITPIGEELFEIVRPPANEAFIQVLGEAQSVLGRKLVSA